MKQLLKQLGARLGYFVSKYPRDVAMGFELWRDLDLLLGANPAPLCIDAGANIGDVTARFLALRPKARIHAFEPGSIPLTSLKARYSAHANVTIVPAGLSDAAGEKEFIQYQNGHLSSFLNLERTDKNPFASVAENQKSVVPVYTLDAYCSRQGIDRIDLLKIDTQGYDKRVLEGTRGLIEGGRVQLVLVELNFIPLYVGQAEGCDVLAFLLRNGFQLVDFYEKCRREQCISWCTALFVRR